MPASRRLAIAVLAALSLLLSPAAKAAPGSTPERIDPDLAEIIARVGPQGTIAAFVHFAPSVPYAQGVETIGDTGASISADLPAGHLAYAYGPVASFTTLAVRPEVTFLEHAGTEPLLSETATWATRARTLYESTGGLDIRVRDAGGDLVDGSGVGIAIVDSGVDGSHPDLRWAGSGDPDPQLIKNFKVFCSVPNLEDAGCAGDVVMEDVVDTDTTSGHGTHVAGIAAGTGEASDSDGDLSTTGDRMFRGVAPGAKLYGFGAGEGLSIYVPSAAAAFQWIYDHGLEQDPPIRVVNNSWGGGGAHDPDLAISKLSSALVDDKGITVVFAAGNAGGDGSAIDTNPYASNPTPGVISAANYYDQDSGTRDAALDDSSSRGKSDQPETWPDVSAPGTQINSACKLATVVCPTGLPVAYSPYYTTLTGTSMAAPHTAGVIALLYQADPAITPDEVEDALEDTAHEFVAGAPYEADPANADDLSSFDKGHGLVDARAAVLETLGLPADYGVAPGPGTLPTTTVIASDDAGDHPAGALDLDQVTLTEPGDGTVAITWTVRDAEDFDFSASAVSYRLFSNVDGVPRSLQVRWDGVEVTDAGVFPAQTVSREGNAFTAVYSAEALGATRGAIHLDTWGASYAGVIQDRTPGPEGASFITSPARGEEHVFVVEVAQPDLTLGSSDISFTAQKVSGGQLVTVGARIHNAGLADAANVDVLFTVNGTEAGRSTIDSISAGSSGTTSFEWGITKSLKGIHIVAVAVDHDGEIEEEDEANNTAQRVVEVRGNTLRPR